MDICDRSLAPVLRALNADSGWKCQPFGSGRAIISTGRLFTDGEPVEVIASVKGDIVSVNDGGILLARLAAAGFELDDEVHLALWRDALYAARLSYDEGVVHLMTSVEGSALAIRRLADGMLGLDSLSLVAFPKAARSRTFADDVEGYLRGIVGEDSVTRSPVVDVGQAKVRPSFRVEAKTGPILIQAAATSGFRNSFEHAYATFSLIARSDQAAVLPIQQRLVVLGGSASTWGKARIDMLSDVAIVGLWSEREPIDRFIGGEVPAERVLIGR